ncbi:MAG: hypothetical protein WD512_15565 [Candidatus Paceibacterota bacterium]
MYDKKLLAITLGITSLATIIHLSSKLFQANEEIKTLKKEVQKLKDELTESQPYCNIGFMEYYIRIGRAEHISIEIPRI